MGTLTNKIKIADVIDKGSGAVILYNGKLSVSLLLHFTVLRYCLLLFNISVGMSTFLYEGCAFFKERNSSVVDHLLMV